MLSNQDSQPELFENTTLPHASHKLRNVFFVLAIVLIVAYYLGFSAPLLFPKGGIFTVSPGESLKSIGTDLSNSHFVRSKTFFVTFVTMFGGERRITPGDYYFEQPLSVFGIAWQIARGEHHMDPVKVTIPEGENVREISSLLSLKLPGFPADSFLKLSSTDEGYLFPETYFIYPKTDPKTVHDEMKAMFDKETNSIFKDANLHGHTKSEIITMASILEREAHGDDDRNTVSGILWKRLSKGMMLQVDASVAYAKGVPEIMLQKDDFNIDSPYNTYKYSGLPPAPISNPGQKAILAAINPVDSPYLYYLHDSRGNIHYAKTYAEHQANIKRYLR